MPIIDAAMRNANRRGSPGRAVASLLEPSARNRPKRSLGQHFLIDPGIARKVIREAMLGPGDVVLEIGPGKGALTEPLLEVARQLVAIEIDTGLIEQLVERFLLRPVTSFRGHFPSYRGGRLLLIEADIRQIDLAELHRITHSPAPFRVVGNLPYNQATAILQTLFERRPLIQDIIVLLQREVADRLLASPGHREYGFLSVVAQYYCRVKKLFPVPAGAFSPKPKVQSTMVRLEPIVPDRLPEDRDLRFHRVVSACFRAKRKTLLNNLRHWMSNRSPDWISQQCAEAQIDARCRAETLSVEEFIALSDHLQPEG